VHGRDVAAGRRRSAPAGSRWRRGELVDVRAHDDEHRFSPLQQISEGNVGRLGLLWSRELPTTRGVEATPLVVDGVIYTTAPWSVVHAIDARTGEPRWTSCSMACYGYYSIN
jgi:glucose dehydrogenase